MSDNFAECAARLSGLAAHALGWRPQEFWRATPAELVLCLPETNSAEPRMDRSELRGLMAKLTQERDDDG